MKQNPSSTTARAPREHVRYAVIGLGKIAQVAVLPAFEHARRNSRLMALVSSDPEKLRVLGSRYDVPHRCSYEDFDDLAASGNLDAVYIALPNSLHRGWAERAMRAGLHVLCEKPMALDETECTAMIDAAARSEVKLMIAYRLHFEKANLEVLDLVRSGAIGDPRFFTSAFSHVVHADDVRMRGDLGGGVLYDLGVYPINAARCLFADEPIQVTGYMDEDEERGVDITTAATLRFRGNRLAQFAVSQGASDSSYYRIVGTKGEIMLEQAFEYAESMKLTICSSGKSHHYRVPRRDQFAPELIYFSRAVLLGEEPEPSGEEGLADIRVVRAIRQAVEEGRSIDLPPFERSKRPSLAQEIHRRPVRRQKTIHVPLH